MNTTDPQTNGAYALLCLIERRLELLIEEKPSQAQEWDGLLTLILATLDHPNVLLDTPTPDDPLYVSTLTTIAVEATRESLEYQVSCGRTLASELIAGGDSAMAALGLPCDGSAP